MAEAEHEPIPLVFWITVLIVLTGVGLFALAVSETIGLLPASNDLLGLPFGTPRKVWAGFALAFFGMMQLFLFGFKGNALRNVFAGACFFGAVLFGYLFVQEAGALVG